MPSGVVIYLMSRLTAAPMLLLPSSTDGMYALLMAPGIESLLATVKYTIPDKNTRNMEPHGTSCTSLSAAPDGTSKVSKYMVLMCATHTEFGVVVVPVVVQSHNVLLLFEEVMVCLSLQVEPSDSDVLW